MPRIRPLVRPATIWGISMTLTPEGLARYDEVAAHAHAFLRTLEASLIADGADALPPYFLREKRTMSKLGFEYAEKAESLPLVKVRDLATSPSFDGFH